MVTRRVASTLASAKRAGVALHVKRIWNEYPALKDITVNVKNHFGDFSIDQKVPLSDNALRTACHGFLEQKRAGIVEHQEFFYLYSLFSAFGEVAHVRVRVGTNIWNPIGSESYSTFCESRIVKIEPNIAEPIDEAAIALMKVFLDRKTVNVIKRLYIKQD